MFSWLFGGGDTATKAVEVAGSALSGIGTWIDEKDFTEEEKSKTLAKAAETHLKLVELTANENSIRSITRRYLAWGIVGFTLFWASVAMVFAILEKEKIVNNMILVADAFYLGIAFSAVVVFYFGVAVTRSLLKR